jgi:hypothetical protein
MFQPAMQDSFNPVDTTIHIAREAIHRAARANAALEAERLHDAIEALQLARIQHLRWHTSAGSIAATQSRFPL